MRILYLLQILALLLFHSGVVAEKRGSLYELPFNWQDQSGTKFELKSLRGKMVILTLAYTKCKTACPLTMQRLKAIDKELTGKGKDPHFVVVSLDSETDTPQKMAEFERQYALDKDRWHLLSGNDADVRKLSVILSYSYQKMPEAAIKEAKVKDEIVHSNKIVFLNTGGEIQAELEGLTSDVKPFANKILNF